MNQNFFETCRTVAETKSLYRFLAKEYHPDHKPLAEKDRYNAIMATVNEQYHSKLKSLNGEKTLNRETGKEHEYKYNPIVEQHTMDALCKLFAFADIPDYVTISIVGTWVWVENVQRTDKAFIQHIKNCNVQDDTGWNFYFRWNSTRLCWQFNPSKYKAQYSKSSNEVIKGYYGTKEYRKSDSNNIE